MWGRHTPWQKPVAWAINRSGPFPPWSVYAMDTPSGVTVVAMEFRKIRCCRGQDEADKERLESGPAAGSVVRGARA